jgi:hypothetical protein
VLPSAVTIVSAALACRVPIDRKYKPETNPIPRLRVELVAVMFLKCHSRFKDGKEHRYWNIVENRRCGRSKFVQRQVLYLGEINDTQRESWCRTIEIFDENRERTMPLALFPADRQLPNFAAGFGVQVRLKEMELHRPRQWGACWLACYLYEQLGLDEFWTQRLPDSREGTCWQHILETLVCYRLIDPGSEWRLHRQWFEQSAMGDLLDEDFSLVEKNALYRCLDKVLKHKEQLIEEVQLQCFKAKNKKPHPQPIQRPSLTV